MSVGNNTFWRNNVFLENEQSRKEGRKRLRIDKVIHEKQASHTPSIDNNVSKNLLSLMLVRLVSVNFVVCGSVGCVENVNYAGMLN